MDICLVEIVNNEGPFTWEQCIFSAVPRVPFGEFFLNCKPITWEKMCFLRCISPPIRGSFLNLMRISRLANHSNNVSLVAIRQ